MLRKLFFWSHLVVGLVTGLFVLLLCLTGAILSFELQLIDLVERDARARPPASGGEWLPATQIAAAAKQKTTEKISGIEWFADPDMPVRVMTDKRHVVMVNGYTGEVLSEGAASLRDFMRWATALHVNLTTGPVGHTFVACSNAAFVFILLSGLWLWWPRAWRWKALRSSLAIRFDVKGKARDWNWHNALGFWFLLPLLFISCTGVVMSFRAVDQWWRSFGGTQVLGPAEPAVRPAPAAGEATTWPQWLKRIQERHPGWRSIALFGEGAPNKEGVFAFSVNGGTLRQTRRVVNVRLDPRNGQIVEERGWSSNDNSQRARSIARLGHTGEFFGTWGQFLALLACLAGLMLVYTGFALSWRRFVKTAAPAAG